MKIKQLEWKYTGYCDSHISEYIGYWVDDYNEKWSAGFSIGDRDEYFDEKFNSEAEAKAFCEQHYVDFISQALEQ